MLAEPTRWSRARSGRSQSFLRFSLGFWSGETRARAWLLTSAVLFFLLANLGAALAVNRWYKFFFDALEQKDTKAVVLGLGLVLALPVFSVAFSVGLPGVVIEATHQCMTTRGVHKSGVTMVISRCWVRFGQERKLGTSFSPLSI